MPLLPALIILRLHSVLLSVLPVPVLLLSVLLLPVLLLLLPVVLVVLHRRCVVCSHPPPAAQARIARVALLRPLGSRNEPGVEGHRVVQQPASPPPPNEKGCCNKEQHEHDDSHQREHRPRKGLVLQERRRVLRAGDGASALRWTGGRRHQL